MHRPALLLLLPLLLAPSHGLRAQQVHRCVDADGRTVYSDRACVDIGAVPRVPPASAAGNGGGTRHYRRGCPRTLGDLSAEIGAAIQNDDLNRLSALYDWSGVSDASAGRLLDRLEAITARPLVDIVPVYPEVATAAPVPPSDQAAVDALPSDDAPIAVPPPAPAPRPTGLRVEQTLANGTTPSRTVFGLNRRFGCFWVRL